MESDKEESRRKGKEEGRAQANNMINYLLESGKVDDVKRIVTDPVYQEHLLKKYEEGYEEEFKKGFEKGFRESMQRVNGLLQRQEQR